MSEGTVRLVLVGRGKLWLRRLAVIEQLDNEPLPEVGDWYTFGDERLYVVAREPPLPCGDVIVGVHLASDVPS